MTAKIILNEVTTKNTVYSSKATGRLIILFGFIYIFFLTYIGNNIYYCIIFSRHIFDLIHKMNKIWPQACSF